MNLESTSVVEIKSIEFLELKKLNLINTKVGNVGFLKKSPIEVLKLPNLWVDLTVLKDKTTLKQLYINEDIYPEEYINSLSLQDKVIFYK